MKDDLQPLHAQLYENFVKLKENHRKRKEDDFFWKGQISNVLSNFAYDACGPHLLQKSWR